MSFSQDSKFFRAVFSVLALLVGNDRHREVNAADVSWAEAGASLAASNYGLLTEEDVKFYRNPPNYGVFEEYVTLPPTGVLMPPVEFNGDGKMAKIELEGGLGRCNDGSNPVYYIAYGKQTTKWVLFLEGGDWCTRYENLGDKDGKRNCLERRDKTGLQGGTTRDDPSDLSLDRMGQEYGQLDTNPDRNPLMHDWNKVYVRNCDGSSFTSARRDVKRVDGEIIFFRGKFILDEVLEDLLLRRHLSFATDVVVSGCSAGGLAVYIHTDRIEEAIRHDAKAAGRSLGDVSSINVVALADSGFFLHHAGGSGDCNFIQRMQFLFLEMNISSSIQPACADAFEDNDRYKCLFAETAIHFSKARTFTLQSINDGWQLRWIGCNAADDAEKRAWYGNEMWEALDLAMRHPKNGGFIDACQHHCHCYENVVIDGDNQAEAFEKFYNDDPRRVWRTKICDIKLEGECPLKSS